MSEKLRIEEVAPTAWKRITAGSLAAALLFGLLYLLADGPFLPGLFRLSAFAGFAAAVIAALQWMGRAHTMVLTINEDNLAVSYLSSGKEVQEELFERDTVHRVHAVAAPPALGFFAMDDAVKVEMTFTDTDNRLSAFRLHGKDRYLAPDDARRACDFIARATAAQSSPAGPGPSGHQAGSG